MKSYTWTLKGKTIVALMPDTISLEQIRKMIALNSKCTVSDLENVEPNIQNGPGIIAVQHDCDEVESEVTEERKFNFVVK